MRRYDIAGRLKAHPWPVGLTVSMDCIDAPLRSDDVKRLTSANILFDLTPPTDRRRHADWLFAKTWRRRKPRTES